MDEKSVQQQTFTPRPLKRRWHRVGKFLLFLFPFLVAFYLGLWVLIESKVYRLRHLLADLKALQPGVSSFDDAARIGKKYGADKPTKEAPCTREKCSLAMSITWCNPQWIPTNYIDNRFLNRLGIHFWTAEGWIEVNKNRVTSLGASIAVEKPYPQHLWHEATWEMHQQIPPVNPSDEKEFRKNFDPKYDRSPEFLVNWTGSHIADREEWLYARTSGRATDEQRHAAEDFNLKCLTRWGACWSVCDILPGAARYYNQGLSTVDLFFPHPRCD